MDKPQSEKKKNGRLLPILLSAFLAAVLILGAVLLTVSAVQRSRFAVRYGNTGVDEKTLAYLSLYAKQSYLAELHSAGVNGAEDTAAFWASAGEDGTPYGDLLDQKIRDYVGGLLIAASLFDRASSLGKDGKAQIRRYLDERIEYMANGSEKEYNEAVKACGFDRKSAEKAVTLQYKAKFALAALYGADGSGIASETEFLARELGEYAHIELFYVDAAYGAALDTIRKAIAGSETAEISPYQFGVLKERYDIGDTAVAVTDGFYFREGTAYTNAYAAVYPEVVEKALSMEIGTYAETACRMERSPAEGAPAETIDAVCFLYRYEPSAMAYADSGNDEFFGDFFALAAEKRFEEVIDGLLSDVVFTAGYDASRLIALPYGNYYQYFVRF